MLSNLPVQSSAVKRATLSKFDSDATASAGSSPATATGTAVDGSPSVRPLALRRSLASVLASVRLESTLMSALGHTAAGVAQQSSPGLPSSGHGSPVLPPGRAATGGGRLPRRSMLKAVTTAGDVHADGDGTSSLPVSGGATGVSGGAAAVNVGGGGGGDGGNAHGSSNVRKGSGGADVSGDARAVSSGSSAAASQQPPQGLRGRPAGPAGRSTVRVSLGGSSVGDDDADNGSHGRSVVVTDVMHIRKLAQVRSVKCRSMRDGKWMGWGSGAADIGSAGCDT